MLLKWSDFIVFVPYLGRNLISQQLRGITQLVHLMDTYRAQTGSIKQLKYLLHQVLSLPSDLMQNTEDVDCGVMELNHTSRWSGCRKCELCPFCITHITLSGQVSHVCLQAELVILGFNFISFANVIPSEAYSILCAVKFSLIYSGSQRMANMIPSCPTLFK